MVLIHYCPICHKGYKKQGWLSRHKWKYGHFTQAEIDENKRIEWYWKKFIRQAEESLKYPLTPLGSPIPFVANSTHKTVQFYRYKNDKK